MEPWGRRAPDPRPQPQQRLCWSMPFWDRRTSITSQLHSPNDDLHFDGASRLRRSLHWERWASAHPSMNPLCLPSSVFRIRTCEVKHDWRHFWNIFLLLPLFMLSANMLKFSCYLMLRKGKSNKLKFKLYDGCTVWGVRLLKIFDWMIHKCSIGSWADTAAAVLPKQGKGNSQKTFYQTFLQHDAPDCMYFAIII